MREILGLVAAAALAAGAVPAAAAPPPAGPHPRIGLGRGVLAALKSRLGSSAALQAVLDECRHAETAPGSRGESMGLNWGSGASACALAYQLTGDRAYAAPGVILWRALLEDVGRIGDRQACVAGASPDQAIASVRRDTGYAIRFVGLHAALAYDWLHDAPGVDEALRKQARDCFRAWTTWYTATGYLRDTPGANYHAGFVAAKTLIAVAAGGEGDADGWTARLWGEVVDGIFAQQLVANGLAADSSGYPSRPGHGALVGGDWAEGWQYGPLSVIEYALAARALDEQGVSWPELRGWLDDLPLRFVYALTPDRRGLYVGGDTERDTPYLAPNAGPLLATLLGPSGDRAARLAAHLRQDLRLERYGPPVFDALAEARPAAPLDPGQVVRSPWFVARGTRTVYARSSFAPDAYWAVFTSPPRLVPDHQHMDASNFVLSRGADALVVDPSPYGSRSSLTGNAMTVESDRVPGDYKPSQTGWSTAELRWARATASGMVAARGDLAGAFKFGEEGSSDVPFARRDWVFLPEGEVVVLDRVQTGGAGRKVYLRFRTPAPLAAAPATGGGLPLARGTVAGSALAIHPVLVRPAAAPLLRAVPRSPECTGSFGACTAARFAVSEYALEIAGAEVLAAHVVDALAAGEPPAEVSALPDPGVAGVAITRGGQRSYVVGSATGWALPPETVSYRVPGGAPGRHVVLDAPDAGTGRTAVSATAAPDGTCTVKLATQGAEMIAARPAVFLVGTAAAGCPIREDRDLPPGDLAGTAGVPPPVQPRSKTAGGCGCAVAGDAGTAAVPLALVVSIGWIARRAPARRRRHRAAARVSCAPCGRPV